MLARHSGTGSESHPYLALITTFQPDPIGTALAEDIGSGDATVEFFIDPAQQASARIFAKEPAIVAGSKLAAEVFTRVDERLAVHVEQPDGSSVAPGQTILTLQGSAGSILTAERVALNFLQRLSGVATLTRCFVDAIAGTQARILDTRKTTPGLRALEKAAVLAGGGHNHRMGLYDMVMVKDNHLLASSETAALQAAIDRARAARPALRIELEADTLEQVRRFLTLAGVDVILLDNMLPTDLRTAVEAGRGRPVQFEASGGVSLETVAAIAATGVQWISVGALTHSARAIDFSLEFLPSADGDRAGR
jgi:nicotinate-nucleotide pyrophosphorylase (carboxylating)